MSITNVDDGVLMLRNLQLIENVCIRYAAALDGRDWASLERCFTPAATYRHPGGVLHGYPAIVDRVCKALTPLERTQHLLGNFRAKSTGDRAECACHFQARHLRSGTPGGDSYTIAGTYRDRLIRTSAGWKIVERVQEYSWTAGNPAVVARGPDVSPQR